MRLKIKMDKMVSKIIKTLMKLKKIKMRMYLSIYSGWIRKGSTNSRIVQKWKFLECIGYYYDCVPYLHCCPTRSRSLLLDKSVTESQSKRAERGRRKVWCECQKWCKHEFFEPKPFCRQKWESKDGHEV